jgi:hypothetical protein
MLAKQSQRRMQYGGEEGEKGQNNDLARDWRRTNVASQERLNGSGIGGDLSFSFFFLDSGRPQHTPIFPICTSSSRLQPTSAASVGELDLSTVLSGGHHTTNYSCSRISQKTRAESWPTTTRRPCRRSIVRYLHPLLHHTLFRFIMIHGSCHQQVHTRQAAYLNTPDKQRPSARF